MSSIKYPTCGTERVGIFLKADDVGIPSKSEHLLLFNLELTDHCYVTFIKQITNIYH